MASSSRGSSSPGAGKSSRKRVRLLYERRINLFTLLVALPGMILSGILIWLQPWSAESRWALVLAELFVWWLLAMALQEQTTRPLQTLANVIAALREEDYSFRARGAAADDVLGELSLEVNALADLLSDQRIRAIEATALLRRVVEEIDTPLFTFDPDRVLRLVNSAGERLLQQPSVRLLGRTADQIGLAACLAAESETIVPLAFHNPNARWLVRRERSAPLPDCPLRCKPRVTRGRAQRLAAPDPGAGPRAQQLTHPHQVHRGKPEYSDRERSAGLRPAPGF
jgi:two-component system, NtrC family, nitrogen regulation sensor histidine kinase NtrY